MSAFVLASLLGPLTGQPRAATSTVAFTTCSSPTNDVAFGSTNDWAWFPLPVARVNGGTTLGSLTKTAADSAHSLWSKNGAPVYLRFKTGARLQASGTDTNAIALAWTTSMTNATLFFAAGRELPTSPQCLIVMQNTDGMMSVLEVFSVTNNYWKAYEVALTRQVTMSETSDIIIFWHPLSGTACTNCNTRIDNVGIRDYSAP
jgi:hypothetical protein